MSICGGGRVGQEPDSAFDEFVEGRATDLLRSAYLLTGDRYAAEKLLQHALERVYIRWSRIGGSPEVYARRALVDGATNRWRRRRHRSEAPQSDAHRPVGADHAGADHAGAVKVGAVVRDALRELPARQRAVVVLRYFDDLSEADVALLLGCSVASVKSHASHGLARLRAAVGATVTPPVPPPGSTS
jgi:RNA polymerase sigma-70 factor (sigma-E family)